MDTGEGGERVMRMPGGGDLPEGMRMLMGDDDDGMDPSTFVFADIEDEGDARVLLDEVESALSAKAMGAQGYRQSPPLGKQRFASMAASFVEPYLIESARDVSEEEDEPEAVPAFGNSRGLGGMYFGDTLTLASLDVSKLSVGDGGGGMQFELPPEMLEGLDLPEGAGDGERSMRLNFSSQAGGWSTYESTHPMADSEFERPVETALVQVSMPLRAPKLGDDVVQARLQVTLWWDETRGVWEPENTTVRYLTESNGDEDGTRRRFRRGGSQS